MTTLRSIETRQTSPPQSPSWTLSMTMRPTHQRISAVSPKDRLKCRKCYSLSQEPDKVIIKVQIVRRARVLFSHKKYSSCSILIGSIRHVIIISRDLWLFTVVSLFPPSKVSSVENDCFMAYWMSYVLYHMYYYPIFRDYVWRHSGEWARCKGGIETKEKTNQTWRWGRQ